MLNIHESDWLLRSGDVDQNFMLLRINHSIIDATMTTLGFFHAKKFIASLYFLSLQVFFYHLGQIHHIHKWPSCNFEKIKLLATK